MRRLLCLALTLALTPSCTLVIDPNRHTGGGAVDTGARDAGPREDTPGLDAPEVVPDAGRDAGGRDAGPPECTTSAECTGISSCVLGYCTLCAPTPGIVDVHADPGLRDDLDLVIGSEGTSREIVVAWRGAGTRVYLHRTPLSAPAAPASPTSVTDAFLALVFESATDILDVALGTGLYEAGEGNIDVALLGRSTATSMFLGAAIYSRNATMPITSLTFPNTQRMMAPNVFLPGIAIQGRGVLTRRGLPTAPTLALHEISYLNTTESTAFDVPTTDPAPFTPFMSHALLDAGADRSTVAVWAYESDTSVGTFATPDRSGEFSAAQLSDGLYLLAYPAGNEIHVRQVQCFGTCFPSATVRTDIRSGSDEVAWVRIALVGTEPVLLSSERVGGEWQLRLRALRADLRQLTTPGGEAAMVIETVDDPDLLSTARIATATDVGGEPYLVLFWMRHPATGDRTARLSSFPLTCP